MELREIRGYASSTRRCMLSGGLPGLTLRELLQVSVGNTLLLRGLWLSVAVALHGAAAVLEHPAVPFELQQWRYGSPGVKPTTFLCANVSMNDSLERCALTGIEKPSTPLMMTVLFVPPLPRNILPR